MRDNIQERLQDKAVPTKINLINLKIEDNEISEITENILKNRPDVSEVYLSVNSISDKGAQTLAESLVKLKSLLVLDLQGNQISEEGFRALFRLKQHHFPQLSLALGDNKINKVGKIARIKKEVEGEVKTEVNK